MYLRLKSFQRFTETWAMLERCGAAGLFESGGFASKGGGLRVVSLGGGPGYELLAYDWFDRCCTMVGDKACDAHVAGRADEWAQLTPRKVGDDTTFVSLDLQASWDTYVYKLGYEFAQWDVHATDAEAAVLGDSNRVVCMLSNVMCYCTDDETADLFTRFVLPTGVTQIGC